MDSESTTIDSLTEQLNALTKSNLEMSEQIKQLTAANTELVNQLGKNETNSENMAERDAMRLLTEALDGLMESEVE